MNTDKERIERPDDDGQDGAGTDSLHDATSVIPEASLTGADEASLAEIDLKDLFAGRLDGCRSHEEILENLFVDGPDGRRSLKEILDDAFRLRAPDYRDYSEDEIGMSRLFMDLFKPVLRYVTERKAWYVYNGVVWRQNDAMAMELCKLFSRIVSEHMREQYESRLECSSLESSSKKVFSEKNSFFKKLTTRRARETLLKDAASVCPISVTDFDKNPKLFNCINGTVDLMTGEFHAHSAEDLITKVAGVEYVPDAACLRWERFIDEVTQGDKDMARYLQKALGMGLLGENPYECFFILYGPTSRNGKGTTMETYMTMMGDYGRAAQPDTITQRQTPNGSGPSEDLARLAGSRALNISEPDKKMTLSSALVKTLTGNDTVTARFLHENSFEFRSGFTLYINTNYLPNIQDASVFTSGRVKIIPFTRHFKENEQDRGLKAELRRPENLSGILNWCLEGLRLLLEEGLDEPEAVLEATGQYQRDSDKIARFLEDCLIHKPGAKTQTSEVYAAYQAWCGANGLKYEGLPKFKQALQSHTKVDRSRIPGAANAVSCVFDYALDSGTVASLTDGQDAAYEPMTLEELRRCLARHGYTLSDDFCNFYYAYSNSRVGGINT